MRKVIRTLVSRSLVYKSAILLFILHFFLICPVISRANELDPAQMIALEYDKLVKMVGENEQLSQTRLEEAILQSLDQLFDFQRLSPQLLEDQWSKITPRQKELFIKVLKTSFARDLISRNSKYHRDGLASLKLENQKVEDSYAILTYSLNGNKGKTKLTISMIKYRDLAWRITNVKVGKKDIRQNYYNYCKKTIDDFSFPYLVSDLGQLDYVILEDFEGNTVGELPRGWTWRDRDEKKNKPYFIREENGKKYLAAEDNGESVILGKIVGWDLKKYPYISFRWRAKFLPKGGDERIGETNDSAAGVYITYRKKMKLIPESVKFVWSTTLPVGTATRRSGTGRPWNVVAESGPDNLGEWHTYVFNAYEVYKKTFGSRPPRSPIGIGILSDANSTKSKAYADYDDIRALKKADADSGVKKYLRGK